MLRRIYSNSRKPTRHKSIRPHPTRISFGSCRTQSVGNDAQAQGITRFSADIPAAGGNSRFSIADNNKGLPQNAPDQSRRGQKASPAIDATDILPQPPLVVPTPQQIALSTLHEVATLISRRTGIPSPAKVPGTATVSSATDIFEQRPVVRQKLDQCAVNRRVALRQSDEISVIAPVAQATDGDIAYSTSGNAGVPHDVRLSGSTATIRLVR